MGSGTMLRKVLYSCRSEPYLLVALYHLWVMSMYGYLLPVLGRWSLLESEMRAREIVHEERVKLPSCA